MMIVILLIMSGVLDAGLIFICQWDTTWQLLWIVPLVWLGCFLALCLIYVAWFALSALFVSLNKPQKGRSAYFDFVLRGFLSVAFFLARVRLDVQGKEYIPQNQNFMLVCNHLSIFDPAVLLGSMPQIPLSFISKKENFQLPVVRKYMHKLNCLPLDRENDRKALQAILKAAQLLRQEHLSMAVFPEGKVSKTGELLPFRNGAFKIAQRAQCPIVVAVLQNTPTIGRNMFLRRTRVKLDILGIIPPEELEHVSTVDIGDRVHEKMETALTGGKTN